jgi:hypothetical protein
MPIATKIQFRRDTAVNWSTINPTLGAGEIGYVTGGSNAWGKVGYFKVGDGTSAWKDLSLAKAGYADTAGTTAKITASALDRTLFVQSTNPTGMVTGDIWIKTGATGGGYAGGDS